MVIGFVSNLLSLTIIWLGPELIVPMIRTEIATFPVSACAPARRNQSASHFSRLSFPLAQRHLRDEASDCLHHRSGLSLRDWVFRLPLAAKRTIDEPDQFR